MPEDELAYELTGFRGYLEALLDRPVTALAYPAGDAYTQVGYVTTAAGYASGVTMARRRTSRRTSALSIRRTVIPRSAAALVQVLDVAYDALRPVDALRKRALLRDRIGHPDPSQQVKRPFPPVPRR